MTYPTKLEECTWTDIQSALEEGYDTVIIPAASVEQHGPHLPLITDTLVGEALAERIAKKLGNAFAAPSLRPGLSTHHMAFPGSLTLDPATFTRLLEEYCLSLAEHGFRFLVLISSHGGNFATMSLSAQSIQEHLWEHGMMATVMPYTDFDQYVGWQQDYLAKEMNITPEEASGHADVAETAMMLAIRPELVRMEKAEAGWMGDLSQVIDQLYANGLQSISQNGVLGDPRRATAEMGEKLLDFLSGEMARDIRERTLCRR